MIKSESIKNLEVALANAQAEMPAVTMDATNPFYKSKYATLGAVIQTSRAILHKHGLAISQLPTSDGNQVGVTTILMHTSGEWIQDTIMISAGEAKNPAQEAGIIISYLRRYAWAAILGMYTEEDTDGNDVAPTNKSETTGGWAKVQIDAALANGFGNVYEFQNAMKLSKVMKPGTIPTPGLLYWIKEYKNARIVDKAEPEMAAQIADDAYLAEKARKAQDAATEKPQ
jgi:hypothetical protein